MNKKIIRVVNLILAFIPISLIIFTWHALPDSIPAHFNFSGHVTRYGSKYESFILPAVALIIFFSFSQFEKHVLKDKQNGKRDSVILSWTCTGILLFCIMVTVRILFIAFTEVEATANFDNIKMLALMLCLILVMIGLMLPKCKQNVLIGIRTKWTLNSELVWTKTHKFGGVVLPIFGLMSAILCMFVVNARTGFLVAITSTSISVLAVVFYSYLIYKQNKIS